MRPTPSPLCGDDNRLEQHHGADAGKKKPEQRREVAGPHARRCSERKRLRQHDGDRAESGERASAPKVLATGQPRRHVFPPDTTSARASLLLRRQPQAADELDPDGLFRLV